MRHQSWLTYREASGKFLDVEGTRPMPKTEGLKHVLGSRNIVGDNHVQYLIEIWCRPDSPADEKAADLVAEIKADLAGKPEPIKVQLTPDQAQQLGIEPGVEVTREELEKRGLWPLPGTPTIDQAEKDALAAKPTADDNQGGEELY